MDETNLQPVPSTETPEDKLDRMFRASHSNPSQPGVLPPRHFVRKLPDEDERLKHGLVEKRSYENSFWQVAARVHVFSLFKSSRLPCNSLWKVPPLASRR